MSDEYPNPVPGSDLAAARRQCGVTQVALAARMGVHRITLNGWERAPSVDPLRAARYHKALREMVLEATA
jgi:DNA-binding transcriptional regulator YiaG